MKLETGQDYSPVAVLPLAVFNPLAEDICVENPDKRFIWDNVHVVTESPLLSGADGTNNLSLFTMGMLNNVSRCVLELCGNEGRLSSR